MNSEQLQLPMQVPAQHLMFSLQFIWIYTDLQSDLWKLAQERLEKESVTFPE